MWDGQSNVFAAETQWIMSSSLVSIAMSVGFFVYRITYTVAVAASRVDASVGFCGWNRGAKVYRKSERCGEKRRIEQLSPVTSE